MRRLARAAACAALAAASTLVDAQACRPGTSEYTRIQVAPNRVRIYCVCNAELGAMTENDAAIREIEQRLQSDRTAIERWQAELPDLQRSLDEWVRLDERGRAATRARALDGALGASIGLVQLRAQQGVRMTQAEIQALWRDFNASSLGSPRFHQAVRDSNRHAEAVRQWQNLEEFAQSANDLQNMVGALEESQQEEYGRALVNLLSLALRDPRLSILVAELDFASTAVLGNITARTARTRVQQLADLGDARLKAVTGLAARYRANVDALQSAKARREQIFERAANPGASCPPGPMSMR